MTKLDEHPTTSISSSRQNKSQCKFKLNFIGHALSTSSMKLFGRSMSSSEYFGIPSTKK